MEISGKKIRISVTLVFLTFYILTRSFIILWFSYPISFLKKQAYDIAIPSVCVSFHSTSEEGDRFLRSLV
jgi:hypothetical protein